MTQVWTFWLSNIFKEILIVLLDGIFDFVEKNSLKVVKNIFFLLILQ